MNKIQLNRMYNQYKRELLDDSVAFWSKYSIDNEHGGFFTYLEKNGNVYSTDKPMWLQGRGVWLYSRLYNKVEKKKEWLDTAKKAMDFILKYGFDADGRMFFETTRDGKPIRKRRYLYTEVFGTMALAEYGLAADNDELKKKAKELYKLILDYFYNNKLEPKDIPGTRPMKTHAMAMILINLTHVVKQIDNDPLYDKIINRCINEVLNDFYSKEHDILLENVGPNGEFIDTPAGRVVNPGHAIETSWFIMEEAKRRNNTSLLNCALHILERSMEIGWDKEYGGLLNFVHVDGKPPVELEWDMKFWWPHTEALYAYILAYSMTNKEKYLHEFNKVYEWTYNHFPEKEYGEWYGYLHRDGSVALPVKGSRWKGPFHQPRYLLNTMLLLDEMIKK